MNKADARHVRSREAIENASIALFLRDPTAGMSEVALAAGVGRATLYRHFDSRDKLIQALARKCLAESEDRMAPLRNSQLTGKAAIEAAIDLLMPMADRYKFLLSLWDIADDDPLVREIYDQQLDELLVLVQQAKAQRELRQNLPEDWILMVFDSLLYVAWLQTQQQNVSAEDAGALFKETLFAGLG